jgi:hypothetical protein
MLNIGLLLGGGVCVLAFARLNLRPLAFVALALLVERVAHIAATLRYLEIEPEARPSSILGPNDLARGDRSISRRRSFAR